MEANKSAKRGIDERSAEIRERYLAQSGGWLGELIIWTVDLTGVWDVLILCTVITVVWVIMRTTTLEICFVLGLAFDLVIPLQYNGDKKSYREHRSHLDHYWSILFFATAAEVAAYLMIHPELFSLFACLKTFLCSLVWMGITEDGVYLSSAITRGVRAPVDGPASEPVKQTKQPKSRGSRKKDVWQDDMDELLDSWGYDSLPARTRMIDRLSKTHSDDRPGVLDKWKKGIPTDSRVPGANEKLKKLYPDPLVRYGMMDALKKNENDEQVASNLDRWVKEKDHVSRRTAQYFKKAEEALGLDVPKGGAGGRQSKGTIPELPRIEISGIPDAQRRIEKVYDDPMTVWGMLDYLRMQDKESAKRRVKVWESDTQSDKDKERRSKEYRERAEEMMDIVKPNGRRGGKEFSNGRIKEVREAMREHDIRQSDQDIMLDAFKRQRTPSEEAAIVSRLQRLGMEWRVPDKYAADLPVERPAGGATPSGLPNEWMDELDQKLYDASHADRQKTLELFARGTNTFEESKKKRKVFKQLDDLSPPRTPGSYDTDGGKLGYSHDELFERRRTLEEVGYARQTIDPMLADLKNQPSKNIADRLMDSWINASKSLEDQRRVVLDYQAKGLPVSTW